MTSKDKQEATKETIHPAVWMILSAVFIIAITKLYFYVVKCNYDTMATRGQFGDLFGGLNAVFSGLAFAGLILALYMQRKELSLQREELKLTREEMKRSASAQEESSRQLYEQAKLAKRQLEDDNRPFINPYFDLGRHEIYLVIENSGNSPAYNLKISVTKCFQIKDQSLSDRIKATIESFGLLVVPKGGKFKLPIFNTLEFSRFFSTADSESIELKFEFSHKKDPQEFTINAGIGHFRYIQLLERGDDVAALDRINKSIESLGAQLGKIKDKIR